MTDFRCVFRFTLFIITYLLLLLLLLPLLLLLRRRRRRRYAFYFHSLFLFVSTWFLYTFSFHCQLTNYYYTARTPAVATGHGPRSDAAVYTVPTYNIHNTSIHWYTSRWISLSAMYLYNTYNV